MRLHVSGFYVRQIPLADGNEPYVVVKGKCVLDANATAVTRGVRVGMGLSEAKVLLRGGSFIKWNFGDYASAQEKWLDVVARYSSAVEPDDQHTAFLDLSGHPDPLVIALDARDAIEALNYSVNWSIATTKWLAKIGADLKAQDEPLRDLANFLWPLPIERLPISQKAIDQFQMLGYVTVGQLCELDTQTLSEQFGDEGLRIYQLIWGGGYEPVLSLYPRCSLAEQMYFDSTIDSQEIFDNGLHVISQRLGEKLNQDDLSGSLVQISIDTEHGTYSNQRNFSKSFSCAKTIYCALCLTVPIVDMPVSGIRVRLPNLTKSKRLQRSFDGQPATRQLSADTAFVAVRKVFGDQAVQRASDIATKRRDRLLREWKNATGWR